MFLEHPNSQRSFSFSKSLNEVEMRSYLCVRCKPGLIGIFTYRYMTEVRRLALPQSQTEAVYRGFKELEEALISPYSF